MAHTIVEYLGLQQSNHCGYCKTDTPDKFTHGMWAHLMSVQDYQDLIDRGWRRSGKYTYKPVMDKTCCPQYAIRCEALNFKPSRSQKRLLKRMNHLLEHGEIVEKIREKKEKATNNKAPNAVNQQHKPCDEVIPKERDRTQKAKHKRLRKKIEKMVKNGELTAEEAKTFAFPRRIIPSKTIEELLKTKTNAGKSQELTAEESPVEGHPGYGSFHQHYLLDGKIIAVAVLDILPNSISSVYFYYDPAYEHLALGNYSALREIAFTRELCALTPQLCYYYMGFYVHQCQKMNYKARYFPSFLLCPETYIWIGKETAVPKLNEHKYSRFAPLEQESDTKGKAADVMVLYKRQALPYLVYQQLTKSSDEDVGEYAELVGKECAKRILLYRE